MKITKVTGLLLIYEDHRGNRCLCSVNQYDAQTALLVLSQSREERLRTGQGIATALDILASRGKLYATDACLNVRVNTNGIVSQARKDLYWRVCRFLMYCCASQDNLALQILKDTLTRYIASGDVHFCNAFKEANTLRNSATILHNPAI